MESNILVFSRQRGSASQVFLLASVVCLVFLLGQRIYDQTNFPRIQREFSDNDGFEEVVTYTRLYSLPLRGLNNSRDLQMQLLKETLEEKEKNLEYFKQKVNILLKATREFMREDSLLHSLQEQKPSLPVNNTLKDLLLKNDLIIDGRLTQRRKVLKKLRDMERLISASNHEEARKEGESSKVKEEKTNTNTSTPIIEESSGIITMKENAKEMKNTTQTEASDRELFSDILKDKEEGVKGEELAGTSTDDGSGAEEKDIYIV